MDIVSVSVFRYFRVDFEHGNLDRKCLSSWTNLIVFIVLGSLVNGMPFLRFLQSRHKAAQ